MIKKFTLLIVALIAILISGCGQPQTPQSALDEILIALNERDEQKFNSHVDMNNFLVTTHNDVSAEILKNFDDYKAKYPQDPFFQNSIPFVKDYLNKYRDEHINLTSTALNAYFDKNLKSPKDFVDNPAAWIASEFKHVHNACTSKVTASDVKDNSAVITLEVTGDNSIYGKLIGNLTFKLYFERRNDQWYLTKIANIDELIDDVVDKAEIVWPNQDVN